MRNLVFLVSFVLSVNCHASLKSIGSQKSPFKLPELSYQHDAFVDVIDAETMKIHHSKHHQAYVDNLNKALDGQAKKSLSEILAKVSEYPVAVRNNGGGHWNHSFFWTLLTNDKKKQAMPPSLKKLIENNFGSFEAFKEQFEKAGNSQFGSGWAWLIVNSAGQLEIVSTPNQDNPIMHSSSTKGTPILGIDVWEHAYYLKYQNRRAQYTKAIWEIVNWSQVESYYKEAIRK